MKKVTFFGAAAVALMAASAAHAEGGYVGGVYGNVDAGALGDSDFYGVEGAFAGANFEIDAAFTDSDDSDSAFGVAGHLFQRNDRSLIGAFASINDASDSTTWTVGGEANAYLDSVTLAGALIYGSNDDVDADGYGLNTEARFFPSDNFRLDARLGYATIDAGGFEEDVLTYGAGGEFQLSQTPVSFTLNWRTIDADATNLSADSLTVGVRYNWGGTLRDRDRTGASQASLVGFAF
jgi:hypothetical protein